jgi:uncharacterized protein DUF4236
VSWRFRKSFRIIPGVRLNVSRSGTSVTLGGAPFSVNLGPHGLHGTASIPGTGISYRQRLDGPQTHSAPADLPATLVPAPPTSHTLDIEQVEIRSASTETLTSPNMAELKRILHGAFDQRSELDGEIKLAKPDRDSSAKKADRWQRGFLFKRVFPNRFAQIKDRAGTAAERVAELEEQLRQSVVATEIDIAAGQAEPYYRMRDAFSGLCDCSVIWDTLTERHIDRVRARSHASLIVTRKPVTFSLGACDLINWGQQVPWVRNAMGGEMFIYPGFALYRTSLQAFSVIDASEIVLTRGRVEFTEAEGVPKDSRVIGNTWAKVNKDGSPDRRFSNNLQVPLCRVRGGAVHNGHGSSGRIHGLQFSALGSICRRLGEVGQGGVTARLATIQSLVVHCAK